jgi:hypothetical protein
MTPSFATQANCSLSPSPKLTVTAANGGHLVTEFTCYNCAYSIQGVPFTSDFKILQLQGYDLILGGEWIHNHSLVTLDYKRMTLKVTTSTGLVVKFHDESLPNYIPTENSSNINKLLSICGALLLLQLANTIDTPQPTIGGNSATITAVSRHFLSTYHPTTSKTL